MSTKELFILTLLVTIAVTMFLVLPIVIGIGVYRHAKKHPDLGNPMSLALLAMFVPLYLGLVYYLYVYDEYQTKRYDESKKG